VLFHPGPVQVSHPTVSELCYDCIFIKNKDMLLQLGANRKAFQIKINILNFTYL
jgi:hypothetical protein